MINEYLQSNITTEPMFCICDGNDSLRTVVTGVKVFNKTMTRTLVYILPCCGNQDTVTTTDWMIKQHHKYSRKNEKVESTVIKIFHDRIMLLILVFLGNYKEIQFIWLQPEKL